MRLKCLSARFVIDIAIIGAKVSILDEVESQMPFG